MLLLYAQPLVRIAALQTSDITEEDDGLHLKLGKHPAVVPKPFADLLRTHMAHRPNLRTGSGPDSPWLFPGSRAGRHIDPMTITHRLLNLGVDRLGARSRAITDLATEVPPVLVADALGYAPVTVIGHAAAAGDTWARYAGRKAKPT